MAKKETLDPIAEALFDISKSLRLLGNGNVAREDLSPGAIEGLAMLISGARSGRGGLEISLGRINLGAIIQVQKDDFLLAEITQLLKRADYR